MISALWIAVAAVVVSAAVLVYGWSRIRHVGEKRLAEAEREAARMREEARRDSEAKLKEGELAAKEKLLQARTEFETASRARRGELETLERRLTQKEDSLDKRMGELDQRDKELVGRDRTLTGREREVAGKEVEADRLVAEQRNRLEQIAGLTAQQAKDELTRGLENEARIDAAHLVKRIEDEAREQGNRKAQWLMGLAVQRLASDYISETTVSVVELPSDEMKGRIIGREGRNIRALELATGIDLIVDDTPEAVILSGFDPYRREIARVALERLIADGRIHPARIEEVVEKVKAEFEQRIQQEGDAALLELKIPGMHPELVKLMGLKPDQDPIKVLGVPKIFQ